MTKPAPATTMHQDGDTGSVTVTDVFATDAADLWGAITEPDRLRRWIAEVSGDLHQDGVFAARFTSTWEGAGRVDVCDPPRRLLVTMTEEDGAATVIEATLTPRDDGTELVVQERGLPLVGLHFYGAGWQVHVEDLRAALSGTEAEEWKPRWEQRLPEFESAPVHAR